jgi:hypothetical protein
MKLEAMSTSFNVPSGTHQSVLLPDNGEGVMMTEEDMDVTLGGAATIQIQTNQLGDVSRAGIVLVKSLGTNQILLKSQCDLSTFNTIQQKIVHGSHAENFSGHCTFPDTSKLPERCILYNNAPTNYVAGTQETVTIPMYMHLKTKDSAPYRDQFRDGVANKKSMPSKGESTTDCTLESHKPKAHEMDARELDENGTEAYEQTDQKEATLYMDTLLKKEDEEDDDNIHNHHSEYKVTKVYPDIFEDLTQLPKEDDDESKECDTFNMDYTTVIEFDYTKRNSFTRSCRHHLNDFYSKHMTKSDLLSPMVESISQDYVSSFRSVKDGQWYEGLYEYRPNIKLEPTWKKQIMDQAELFFEKRAMDKLGYHVEKKENLSTCSVYFKHQTEFSKIPKKLTAKYKSLHTKQTTPPHVKTLAHEIHRQKRNIKDGTVESIQFQKISLCRVPDCSDQYDAQSNLNFGLKKFRPLTGDGPRRMNDTWMHYSHKHVLHQNNVICKRIATEDYYEDMMDKIVANMSKSRGMDLHLSSSYPICIDRFYIYNGCNIPLVELYPIDPSIPSILSQQYPSSYEEPTHEEKESSYVFEYSQETKNIPTLLLRRMIRVDQMNNHCELLKTFMDSTMREEVYKYTQKTHDSPWEESNTLTLLRLEITLCPFIQTLAFFFPIFPKVASEHFQKYELSKFQLFLEEEILTGVPLCGAHIQDIYCQAPPSLSSLPCEVQLVKMFCHSWKSIVNKYALVAPQKGSPFYEALESGNYDTIRDKFQIAFCLLYRLSMAHRLLKSIESCHIVKGVGKREWDRVPHVATDYILDTDAEEQSGKKDFHAYYKEGAYKCQLFIDTHIFGFCYVKWDNEAWSWSDLGWYGYNQRIPSEARPYAAVNTTKTEGGIEENNGQSGIHVLGNHSPIILYYPHALHVLPCEDEMPNNDLCITHGNIYSDTNAKPNNPDLKQAFMHLIACKTMNQKCQVRNFPNIFGKYTVGAQSIRQSTEFKGFPTIHLFLVMVVICGLLGNIRSATVRLLFYKRIQLYAPFIPRPNGSSVPIYGPNFETNFWDLEFEKQRPWGHSYKKKEPNPKNVESSLTSDSYMKEDVSSEIGSQSQYRGYSSSLIESQLKKVTARSVQDTGRFTVVYPRDSEGVEMLYKQLISETLCFKMYGNPPTQRVFTLSGLNMYNVNRWNDPSKDWFISWASEHPSLFLFLLKEYNQIGFEYHKVIDFTLHDFDQWYISKAKLQLVMDKIRKIYNTDGGIEPGYFETYGRNCAEQWDDDHVMSALSEKVVWFNKEHQVSEKAYQKTVFQLIENTCLRFHEESKKFFIKLKKGAFIEITIKSMKRVLSLLLQTAMKTLKGGKEGNIGTVVRDMDLSKLDKMAEDEDRDDDDDKDDDEDMNMNDSSPRQPSQENNDDSQTSHDTITTVQNAPAPTPTLFSPPIRGRSSSNRGRSRSSTLTASRRGARGPRYRGKRGGSERGNENTSLFQSDALTPDSSMEFTTGHHKQKSKKRKREPERDKDKERQKGKHNISSFYLSAPSKPRIPTIATCRVSRGRGRGRGRGKHQGRKTNCIFVLYNSHYSEEICHMDPNNPHDVMYATHLYGRTDYSDLHRVGSIPPGRSPITLPSQKASDSDHQGAGSGDQFVTNAGPEIESSSSSSSSATSAQPDAPSVRPQHGNSVIASLIDELHEDIDIAKTIDEQLSNDRESNMDKESFSSARTTDLKQGVPLSGSTRPPSTKRQRKSSSGPASTTTTPSVNVPPPISLAYDKIEKPEDFRSGGSIGKAIRVLSMRLPYVDTTLMDIVVRDMTIKTKSTKNMYMSPLSYFGVDAVSMAFLSSMIVDYETYDMADFAMLRRFMNILLHSIADFHVIRLYIYFYLYRSNHSYMILSKEVRLKQIGALRRKFRISPSCELSQVLGTVHYSPGTHSLASQMYTLTKPYADCTIDVIRNKRFNNVGCTLFHDTSMTESHIGGPIAESDVHSSSAHLTKKNYHNTVHDMDSKTAALILSEEIHLESKQRDQALNSVHTLHSMGLSSDLQKGVLQYKWKKLDEGDIDMGGMDQEGVSSAEVVVPKTKSSGAISSSLPPSSASSSSFTKDSSLPFHSAKQGQAEKVMDDGDTFHLSRLITLVQNETSLENDRGQLRRDYDATRNPTDVSPHQKREDARSFTNTSGSANNAQSIEDNITVIVANSPDLLNCLEKFVSYFIGHGNKEITFQFVKLLETRVLLHVYYHQLLEKEYKENLPLLKEAISHLVRTGGICKCMYRPTQMTKMDESFKAPQGLTIMYQNNELVIFFDPDTKRQYTFLTNKSRNIIEQYNDIYQLHSFKRNGPEDPYYAIDLVGIVKRLGSKPCTLCCKCGNVTILNHGYTISGTGDIHCGVHKIGAKSLASLKSINFQNDKNTIYDWMEIVNNFIM